MRFDGEYVYGLVLDYIKDYPFNTYVFEETTGFLMNKTSKYIFHFSFSLSSFLNISNKIILNRMIWIVRSISRQLARGMEKSNDALSYMVDWIKIGRWEGIEVGLRSVGLRSVGLRSTEQRQWLHWILYNNLQTCAGRQHFT